MQESGRQGFGFIKSIFTGGVFLLGAAAAQAGPGTGSITFSPAAATAAESIPVLGSTMLILLAVLLAFIAFISLRKQKGGIAPVVAGALVLASLASAGGGVRLLNSAHAGAGTVITNPEGQTLPIFGASFNSYYNDSGVDLRVGPLSLPEGGCPLDVLELPGACNIGDVLGDGASCSIDCYGMDES